MKDPLGKGLEAHLPVLLRNFWVNPPMMQDKLRSREMLNREESNEKGN